MKLEPLTRINKIHTETLRMMAEVCKLRIVLVPLSWNNVYIQPLLKLIMDDRRSYNNVLLIPTCGSLAYCIIKFVDTELV